MQRTKFIALLVGAALLLGAGGASGESKEDDVTAEESADVCAMGGGEATWHFDAEGDLDYVNCDLGGGYGWTFDEDSGNVWGWAEAKETTPKPDPPFDGQFKQQAPPDAGVIDPVEDNPGNGPTRPGRGINRTEQQTAFADRPSTEDDGASDTPDSDVSSEGDAGDDDKKSGFDQFDGGRDDVSGSDQDAGGNDDASGPDQFDDGNDHASGSDEGNTDGGDNAPDDDSSGHKPSQPREYQEAEPAATS